MRAIGVFLGGFLVFATGCSPIENATSDLGGRFYDVPSPLPPGMPGELIRTTPVPSARGSRAWVMLYHSRSIDGRDIAVSGTVVVPDGSPPPDGYPVLSWAHGTTGLADECAPSRTAFSGSLVDDSIVGAFVPRGFAVVATDYEGLGVPGPHPYLVGESEGHSVLDAARAARAVPAVTVSNRVALFGYSQGGHAALWAAQLAETYAPDLDVTAVDAAAPVGDLVRIAKHWGTFDQEEPYLLSALDAWSTAYGLPLQPILTPRGKEARTQIRRRCTAQIDWDAFGSGLVRGRSPAWRGWMDLARSNTPGAGPFDAPVLIQHGDRDDLIPVESSERLFRTLCVQGSQADLRVYAGADHETLDPGFGDAASWIIDTVRGVPRIGSCDA
jgi:acetyl esterase/lipase